MKTMVSFCVLVLTLCFYHSFGMQQPCAEVLGYVRDTSEESLDFRANHSFQYYFCKQIFSSFGAFSDSAQNLGVPIGEMPVSLRIKKNEASWKRESIKLCEDLRTGQTLSKAWSRFVEKANQAVLDAWLQCLNTDGLHFWAEIDSFSPHLFTLRARYNNDGKPYTIKIRGGIDGVDLPTCKGWQEFKEIEKIDRGGIFLSCERAKNKGYRLTLDTHSGIRTISIPPYRPASKWGRAVLFEMRGGKNQTHTPYLVHKGHWPTHEDRFKHFDLIPSGTQLKVIEINTNHVTFKVANLAGSFYGTLFEKEGENYVLGDYLYRIICTEIDNGRKGLLDWARFKIAVSKKEE